MFNTCILWLSLLNPIITIFNKNSIMFVSLRGNGVKDILVMI